LKKLIFQLAILLLALAACPAQVIVDRMAAVVNKRVILESELDQAARVEYLIQGKAIKDGRLSRTELEAVLDQLIDRSLLEQQIVHPDLLAPSQEELAVRLKDIRDGIPGASSDEGWKALLQSYGVTEQDVVEHITSEFRVLRLVDLRFRGLVRIDKSAIARYYEGKFVPELHHRGATPPPLEAVSSQIEKILVEQRVNDMLNEWLQTLRSQAHVDRISHGSTDPSGGAQP
jgi:parvulin-like peptidyl-prolyl isomerase